MAKERKDLEQINDLYKEAKEFSKENFGWISKIFDIEKDIARVKMESNASDEVRKNLSKSKAKDLLEDLESNKKIRDAVDEQAPGFMNIMRSTKKTGANFKMMTKSAFGMIGIGVALVKAFLEFQKAVTETRKELGVSYGQAVAITAQNKVLAQVAKGYGLELDDITSAQAAIRNDLGASVQESVKLSLSFARTSAATGQSAEDLAKTLSIMESISGASRDVLLNQIRTNAAMIEAAGVAPSLVMKDIAESAEFFAKYAKDGGQNIIQAGIAARKLGLEMSAVASITDSLLDFETSIEKQMEASMLLGRQINYDRARQLALAGDTEGVMQEILKQVGGEVEFNRMNVLQRRKLAESVNVSVEQLSRLVRNNQAAATGGAVGAAVGKPESVYSLHESGYDETHRLLGKLVRNTEGI